MYNLIISLLDVYNPIILKAKLKIRLEFSDIVHLVTLIYVHSFHFGKVELSES